MNDDKLDKLPGRLPASALKPPKGLKGQPLAQRMQIPPWIVREARYAEAEQTTVKGPLQFVSELIARFK